jgi:hypothetical protein
MDALCVRRRGRIFIRHTGVLPRVHRNLYGIASYFSSTRCRDLRVMQCTTLPFRRRWLPASSASCRRACCLWCRPSRSDRLEWGRSPGHLFSWTWNPVSVGGLYNRAVLTALFAHQAAFKQCRARNGRVDGCHGSRISHGKRLDNQYLAARHVSLPPEIRLGLRNESPPGTKKMS